MTLSPCTDLAPAAWIPGSDWPWQQLVTLGPPGFAAYARLRFLVDPAYRGQREADAPFDHDRPSEVVALQCVLAVLARHTSTPQHCYFGLWDGWGSEVRGVPMLVVPNRSYYLFEGQLSDVGQWEQMWPGHAANSAAHPAFVWPADRAWCVAWDVDPHFAGIGGSRAAIDELLADQRVDVVEADPRAEQPSYW